jgi:hypothetical protein
MLARLPDSQTDGFRGIHESVWVNVGTVPSYITTDSFHTVTFVLFMIIFPSLLNTEVEATL